jgi:hypothetical protein
MSSNWYEIQKFADELKNRLAVTAIDDAKALESLNDTHDVLIMMADLAKEAQFLMNGEITVHEYNERLVKLRHVYEPQLDAAAK